MIDQQPAFAKFRLNKDLEISEAYIISTEEADVIDWTGKKSDTAEVRPDEAALPSPNAFKGLYKSFVNDALAFYRTVPFVMAHIQLIVKMRRDFSVRQEIEQNAISSNKTAEFESYTFPANLTASINRKIEELDAVEAGIKVLPNLFTIGLITMYDTHFAQLMKAIMRSKPHSISESNKNITFKDLSEIGTIAGAQERIMDREIDDVMRSNHVAQLEWIEKAVPIDLMKDNPILPKFVEVCERRNLLTHTGGKVSPQYLQVCKKHGVDMGSLKIGDLLRPNSAYIRSASLLVFEFGLKLIQVVWQRLCPTETDDALSELCETGYLMIVEDRYELAASLFKFGLDKRRGSDKIRKKMVINYANALKLSGDKSAAERILNEEDFSAATDDFQICVAAVRDDITTVLRLMKPVVDSGAMEVSDLREWEVFRPARSDPQFSKAFEEAFNQSLFVSTMGASAPSVDQVESEQSPQQANALESVRE